MPIDIDLSVSIDVNNCHRSCRYNLGSEIFGTKDLSVNKLMNDVSEYLNIQEDRDGVPCSNPPCGKYKFQKKEEATKRYYSKCTTFPCSSKTTSIEVALGGDAVNAKDSTSHEDNNPTPPSPTALKPVSAMKGSREKRGATPPEKLTVKWAPDVYDPVPTSVSHAVTSNKLYRESKSKKKSKSKSKQKYGSKSSCGNKYKDKKQGRKRGGSSNVGFKFSENKEEEEGEGEGEVDYCELQTTAMEFHVANPDQFCGSSFLKGYDRNLQLSSLGKAT